jgi:hypothetical protein
MTNIQEIANPNKIVFKEAGHEYVWPQTFAKLTSVTTKLKEMQNEFPEEELHKYAEKHNLPVEYVRAKWDDQKRIGLELGNWLHLKLEGILQYKIPDIKLTKESTTTKQLIKDQYIRNYTKQINAYLRFLKRNNLHYLGSEIVVGNTLYAGQIDCLLKQCIHDFKNDKEIEFHNQFQKMKPPFDDLDDCNWNKYCLQVNAYHFLLPEEIKSNFTQQHKIIAFNRNLTKFHVYPVPDMQERIKLLFNDK